MSIKSPFSNLFSKLSAMDEDVRIPDRSGFTFRNQTENHGGTRGRKRKAQGEQHGSYLKKRCYQAQSTTASDAFRDDNSQAEHHQRRSNYPSAGRAEETRTNRKSKPDYNNKRSRGGQNYKPDCNVKKNQRKKTEKYEQRYKNRRYENRHGRRDGTKQDKPRSMSQDFKDQNALLVDGRLVCRHFLYRRCVKEDSCQLLHIQGYNGLIKEPCKFYIQGFCQNGQSCIFMHKSFPCKFFHRRRKCLQEENCRFSHDPLNDLTERLLDEHERRYDVIKEDKEEEETETKEDPDHLTEALRPSFYSSIDAEKETNPHQTEEGPAPDSAEPHGSPPDDQNHQEPVCYSVEAVLGPQLSRTFSSFSKTPGSQESDEAGSFSNQSEVPYSVDAVLRSFKSAPATTLYNPRVVSDTAGGPQNKTLSEKAKDKENTSQVKMFKSFLGSGVNTDTASEVPRRSEEIPSQEDKLERCPPPVSEAEKSATIRTEERTNLLTGTPCFHKLPSNFRFLSKPSSPPSDVGEFEERVAASVEPVAASGDKRVAANVGVHRFAAKQLVDILHNSKKKQPVVKPAASRVAPKSWSKTSNAVEPKETQKRALADRVAPAASEGFIKPEQDHETPAGSEGFIKPERDRKAPAGSEGFIKPERDRVAPAASEGFIKPEQDRKAPAASEGFIKPERDRVAPAASEGFIKPERDRKAPAGSEGFIKPERDRGTPAASEGFIKPERDRKAPAGSEGFIKPERDRKAPAGSEGFIKPERDRETPAASEGFIKPERDRKAPAGSEGFIKPERDRETPAGSEGFIKPERDRKTPAASEGFIKPERSAGGKGNSSSFLSLFATPLGGSGPCFLSRTSLAATRLSAKKPQNNPQPTASGLESISSGPRTESPVTSPSLKNENAAVKQAVTPVSHRSVSSGEQRPPDVSSPRESSTNSVLKTLFLRLKPYQEDGEPQDFLHSGGEREKRSTEVPGRSKVTRPGPTEPRVTAPRLVQLGEKASKDGAEVNRNTATPLRDLFKTLDTTVLHKL